MGHTKNDKSREYSDATFLEGKSFDKSYSTFNQYVNEGGASQEIQLINSKRKPPKKKKKGGDKEEKKKMEKLKNNMTMMANTEGAQSAMGFNPSRLRALEVAYLTKLTPNKSHAKLETTNYPYIPRIPPGGNFTPDMIGKQNYNTSSFTQINNF
jgi:hypothetical protein